jgi:hypothetical protein
VEVAAAEYVKAVTSIQEMNEILLKQFDQMRKMMKK